MSQYARQHPDEEIQHDWLAGGKRVDMPKFTKRLPTLFGRVGHDARPVWPDATPAETPAERDLLALTTRGVTDIEWRRAVYRASIDTIQLALLDPTLTGIVRTHLEGRIDSIKHRPHHSEPLEPMNITPEEQ